MMPQELTAIDDKGRERRRLLDEEAGRPFARVSVLAAAKYRSLTAGPCEEGSGRCEVPDPGPGLPG